MLRLAPLVLVALALFSLSQADDTGCEMTPGSALRNCLGGYASIPPSAGATDSAAGAKYYCKVYQQIADCWAQGKYCREWHPLQIAADKFCAIANETMIPTSSGNSGTVGATPGGGSVSADAAAATSTLRSVLAEASNVVTSIWNDDSGTDIPQIFNDVGTKTEPTWTYAGASATRLITKSSGAGASSTVSSQSSGAKGRSLASPLGLSAVAGLVFLCTGHHL